jgi:hypothetical protein
MCSIRLYTGEIHRKPRLYGLASTFLGPIL